MEKFSSKNGVSVYAYKGDAMTLLAFDLEKNLTEDLAGFSIKVKTGSKEYYLYNKLKFNSKIKLPKEPKYERERYTTEFSPIQKFRWIHVPSSEHYVGNPQFGEYTYEITPRYIKDKMLQPPDKNLMVDVTIDVSPFTDGDIAVGFTRSFISSQAFAYHFGNNLNLKPKGAGLVFDLKQQAGTANRYNKKEKKFTEMPFTYEEIHEYLGWQARDMITGFLNEALADKTVRLDVFAYDLNEPTVVDAFLKLAKQGRIRIILDDYPGHRKDGCAEMVFEKEFKKIAKNKNDIFRGNFSSQAHSKVFIMRKNNKTANAVKVLTGSTNFTLNGLCVNANHTIVFNNKDAAQLYADMFDMSFGDEKMDSFKKSPEAKKDFNFKPNGLPDMTIRFSPHPAAIVKEFFGKITKKINDATSDVLFAVMKDDSNSSILDALQKQVKADNIFTAGITDVRKGMQLYKPNKRTGIRISGLEIATKLPKPFNNIIKVPGLGHNIHHKFVVVDFKGTNPVVYCGSSNLAYTPEQNNGDNLIEIRDKDVVLAFAIEAIRLIDHYSWLNRMLEGEKEKDELFLYDNTQKTSWYKKYFNPKDLRCLERELLMR